jgi:hypothetical protein
LAHDENALPIAALTPKSSDRLAVNFSSSDEATSFSASGAPADTAVPVASSVAAAAAGGVGEGGASGCTGVGGGAGGGAGDGAGDCEKLVSFGAATALGDKAEENQPEQARALGSGWARRDGRVSSETSNRNRNAHRVERRLTQFAARHRFRQSTARSNTHRRRRIVRLVVVCVLSLAYTGCDVFVLCDQAGDGGRQDRLEPAGRQLRAAARERRVCDAACRPAGPGCQRQVCCHSATLASAPALSNFSP